MTADDVEALEARRHAAMLAGDAAALGALLADDLVFVHSSGRVEGKADVVDAAASGTVRYLQLERGRTRVQLLGDVALVHGRLVARVQAGTAVRERRMHTLAVWHGGRLLAWQATPLPEDA